MGTSVFTLVHVLQCRRHAHCTHQIDLNDGRGIIKIVIEAALELAEVPLKHASKPSKKIKDLQEILNDMKFRFRINEMDLAKFIVCRNFGDVLIKL